MKISRADAKELATFQQLLRDGRTRINMEFDLLINELTSALALVNAAIEAHNVRVQDAAAFVNRVADGLRDEYDEKSERWQESDAGQQALAMVEAWEEADLNNVPLVAVLEPDTPDVGCDETLALPLTEEDA